ncbi:MAG: hypothetical protein ACR2PG_21215 [Hyphomicrobiaceae bacterium]
MRHWSPWFASKCSALSLVALSLVAISLVGLGSLVQSTDVQASPVQTLLGAWAGRGTARFEGNRSERIKCNAYYTGGGAKLNIAVRCASPSYKIEIRSKLKNSSGRLSGTWEERNFNAAGQSSGSISEKRLDLSINGGGLTASMAVLFDSKKQKIDVRTGGVDLKSVAIDLRRARRK